MANRRRRRNRLGTVSTQASASSWDPPHSEAGNGDRTSSAYQPPPSICFTAFLFQQGDIGDGGGATAAGAAGAPAAVTAATTCPPPMALVITADAAVGAGSEQPPPPHRNSSSNRDDGDGGGDSNNATATATITSSPLLPLTENTSGRTNTIIGRFIKSGCRRVHSVWRRFGRRRRRKKTARGSSPPPTAKLPSSPNRITPLSTRTDCVYDRESRFLCSVRMSAIGGVVFVAADVATDAAVAFATD